jgi:dTDP-4-amino-4,6-dideoxygalactose transaminase
MLGRHQLPAYSPLPARATAAAVRGLFARGDRCLEPVRETLKSALRASDVLLTDSGTSALALALRVAARRTNGASVALPAYGCYDLATAAVGADCSVMLYDLDPATLSPDLSSLERVLLDGARTVVVAHLFGIPVDVASAQRLANAHGALLVEDAAQGAGATWCGQSLGTFGCMSILSFGRGKGTTAGHGGALAFRGADGIGEGERLPPPGPMDELRAVFGVAGLWLLARPSVYWLPAALPFLRLGETVYQPPAPALALGAVGASVLAATLPLARPEAVSRRSIASRLRVRLEAAGLSGCRGVDGGEPSYLRLPVVSGRVRRVAGLPRARRLGIMSGYPRVLTDLTGFGARCGNDRGRFPGAAELAERLFTLPTHSRLAEPDVQALEQWIDTVAES